METEKLRQWLSDCPFITAPITLEHLEVTPDAVALLSGDTQAVSETRDVDGNLRVTYRSGFTLLRRVRRTLDAMGYAQWLLYFQDWIQQKFIRKEYPATEGSVTGVKARKGSLQEDPATGIWVYKVSLDVEYVKIYPAT